MAEVVAACCGGAALTGWALHLGMDARLVGVVTALPVVAHVLQLLGAVITARFGARRTTLVCVALSRQAFLPFALGPLLPLGPEARQTLLLAVAGVHHGLGILSNNAWNAWIGDLVPGRLRARYFGQRTALCTVVGGVCTLAVGVGLDGSRRSGLVGPVLQSMSLVACLAGAFSVYLMARQHGGAPHPAPLRSPWHGLAAPFRDGRARRVIAYNVVWNAASGLSAPFFGLFLLNDLRSGYVLLAAEGAGLAAAKVATASAWGRVVDRVGAPRVLVACTAGLALSPVAWIACGPERLWPLLVETAVGGVLLGGHSVASFALPLSIAPRRERPFYLGAMAMAGGAAFAVTAFGASAALGHAAGAGALGVTTGVRRLSLRALLAGSAMLRVGAVGAAMRLWTPKEREAAWAASSARGLVARLESAVRPWARRGGGNRSSVHDRLDVFWSRWLANRVFRLEYRGGLLWTVSGRTRPQFITSGVPRASNRGSQPDQAVTETARQRSL